MKTVKVLGIGRPNKGAELMLAAIEEAVRERDPTARVITDTATDAFVRAAFWLHRRTGLPVPSFALVDLASNMPQALRRMAGITADRNVDVFLDASGFAYGDAWGPGKLYMRVVHGRDARRTRGQTLALLPQALGPFETAAFGPYLDALVEEAVLVCARDRQSLDHLVARTGAKANLRRVPDLTIPYVPSAGVAPPGDFAIVPNAKLVEMGALGSAEDYAVLAAATVEAARTAGFGPFLLNHEGAGDLALIRQANSRLARPVPVFDSADAGEIKAALGACRGVFSARFHGLVSALSQGVPAIAVGWSHKYDLLMEEFAVADFVFDPADGPPDALVGRLAAEHEALSSRIGTRAAEAKQAVRAMWDELFAEIGL